MGQTLTHGIYLPDEGERNCYNGLAGNWQLLDGAVGTIAEHTTALAGKAPAVHTHTKSDVTDLLNSNFIPSANNSYDLGSSSYQWNKIYSADVVHTSGNETISGDKVFTQFIRNKSEVLEIGVIPSSNTDIGYRVVDKNNTITANLQYTQYTSGNSQFALNLRTKDSNNNAVNKSVLLNTDQYGTWFNFRPSDNSSISLGSTNYRWSAVYSDSYYYGTTAWGLDKSNVWSQVQTISYSGVPTIRYIHPSLDIGSAPASDCGMQLNFCDAGTNIVSAFQYIKGSGVSRISIGLSTKNSNNQIIGKTLRLQTNQEGTTWDFYPSANGEINLGTSTNKWKTFNGINPGALSLPSATSQSIDITEWVTNSWSANYCDAPFDGYISISCFANSLQINNETKSYGMTFQPGDDGFVIGLMPVCSGDHIKVLFVKTQTSLYEGYKFIKANGNVS